MVTAPHDLIIIGAGISGLSLAYYANRQGLCTLILEQEDRYGGCLHSHRLDGHPFWLELGAHSGFNSYGRLLDIMEQCDLLGRIQKKEKVSFKLLVDNQVRSIFSQLRLLELLGSLPRLFTTRKAGRSVAQYYGRIVGPNNYAQVFGPAFNAVICQEAGGFPAELLFAPKPRRKDVLRSFTLPGGLQTIADTLAAQPNMEIRPGQPVQKLNFDRRIFTVTTPDGSVQAHFVAIATPASTAAVLLEESFPELAAMLAEIVTVTVETVGVVVRRDDLQWPPLAGLIAPRAPFYSVVARDTVPDDTYRGFSFHFRPDRLDDSGKSACIAEVLGVAAGRWVDRTSRINRLPALRVGQQDRIIGIEQLLMDCPLALTGNYFTGVSLEDCVSRSWQEWQRLQKLMAKG
jgi:protoporphyrinogen oxidase